MGGMSITYKDGCKVGATHLLMLQHSLGASAGATCLRHTAVAAWPDMRLAGPTPPPCLQVNWNSPTNCLNIAPGDYVPAVKV
jgi:hypothetical protein